MALDSYAPTIDASGISAPSYSEILADLQDRFRAIYGSDAYITPDTQDGQLLAIFAKAISDANDAAIASFNQMSPLTSQGEGLSSIVKINGITRALATRSQVSLTVNGEVGTVITSGAARDSNGNLWDLPATVTIPAGGTIAVTANAREKGDIRAEPHTVTTVATPTRGWTSVDNATAAVAGVPVESDAALRRRQAASVALPAMTLLESLYGAVIAVPGVVAARVYENSTGAVDSNGVPAHSLAVVVSGGGSTAVATAIMQKRSPGVGLYGTTTVNLVDNVGNTQAIKFTVPTQVDIKVDIELHALTGYTSDVGNAIKDRLDAYFDALPIGSPVYWSRALAQAVGTPGNETFEINTFELYRGAGTPAQDDVAIAYNEKPRGNTAVITITVV